MRGFPARMNEWGGNGNVCFVLFFRMATNIVKTNIEIRFDTQRDKKGPFG
jgi:hypothetical protein